ncbi:transmembrane and ubiquitin-like domain-containing protein 1 isoform X2 [Daphnia carinata]|uniref:transmembrane and ubiquitin-like domain-containing protein 1 isoform X2 n=1 Tax=Daphnia carinata TaxID=120202 RepID=UPI0025804B33|nr:transmembrane and ubiquitin-like domain-containing protein 1 isoform X2 [Daphnia carinata]
MSLIEGIGDEVPIFFVLAAIVIVAFMVLAWKSTDVPETPLSLPVLTFTLSQRVIPAPAGLVADDDGPSFPLEDNESNQEISSAENLEVSSDHQTIANSAIQAENNEETLSEVQSMSQETASDKSDEPRRKQMDASPTRTEAIISVKLMYMDDTHRVVESPISMTIGDFKKTHFKNELNANKVVKLIYNGQVLSEESSILSQVGLDNNSVIHCLIHQPRSTNAATTSPSASTLPGPTQQQSTEDAFPRQSGQQTATESGIDIGGLLVPLFGVILGLVWYCRIAYASYFTAAATTGLVGLSGLCIFSVLIIWYPEPEAP